MRVYMFPGQGSQATGMGTALFSEFPDLVSAADEILGYSLKELCVKNPKGLLDQTRYTQPALYVINALSFYKQQQLTGTMPDFVIGHSLGEFNALHAAECFSFETGLRIVQKRGDLMSRISGGMLAVIKLTPPELERALHEAPELLVRVAIYNSPEQMVLAGSRADLEQVQPMLERRGAKCVLLNTSGPFHTELMQSVSDEFGEFLNTVPLGKLRVPVLANVSASPYADEHVRENLQRQLTQPVRWMQSIEYILGRGQAEFIELGHGQVLSKMIEKIRSKIHPSGNDQFVRWSETRTASQCQNAEQKIAMWNRQFPTGTVVRSIVLQGERRRTKTQAVVLFGHRAATYLEGYEGYFDLDELEVAPADG
jgi:malonyl CoA-acyl carrier protein transacylase